MADLSVFGIISLAAGSSVVGAIVTQALISLREARKTDKDAAFAALYVAIALEDYASQCATVLSEAETYESSGGHAGAQHGDVPDLPEFSASIEWKQFGIAATTKVLSFRVEIENTQSMLRDSWEYGDPESTLPLARQKMADLGLAALLLAIGLRRDGKIDPVNYDTEWNVKKYLEERSAHYIERRIRYDEAMASSAAEMNALIDAALEAKD